MLPIGQTNAPTFMSLMNVVFSEYLDKFFIVYIDDILVCSNTWEENLAHIRKIVQVLREQKLYAKESKCVSGSQEVEYLGFIIKPSGVAINPHVIKSIEDWPINTSRKDIKSFLGIFNYYRRSMKKLLWDCEASHRAYEECSFRVVNECGRCARK